MTTTINKDNRKFQVEAEIINCFNYKVTVYELFEDKSFGFVGKCFSNDLTAAINSIINK